jgi:hypothetical protein
MGNRPLNAGQLEKLISTTAALTFISESFRLISARTKADTRGNIFAFEE